MECTYRKKMRTEEEIKQNDPGITENPILLVRQPSHKLPSVASLKSYSP